jgi:Fe-S-cluster containining protein
VYEIELAGLSWYVTERLEGELRATLKQQLRAHRPGDACPFLVAGACSVHPMRPMACRQFNVFGRPCAEGEDAYYTRRQDVMTPIRRYVDAAFMAVLPFFGVRHKAERRQMVRTGEVHRWAQVLQDLRWDTLAERMDAHERR